MSQRFHWFVVLGVCCSGVVPAPANATPEPAAAAVTKWGGVSQRELPREQPPAVKVQHQARQETQERLAETVHFCVVYTSNPPLMEKIARTAEAARWRAHRAWFDDDPREWQGTTTIYLYANQKEYRRRTGLPALADAQTRMKGGFVYSRSISMPCDAPRLFEDVLPHEVTHTVMALRFNGQTPRWADEGMATLAQSAASRKKLRQGLVESWAKQDLFDVEILLTTTEPRHFQSWEYYYQSMSLVEFFVAERGRHEFMQFLTESILSNYRTALKKHYALGSFAELQKRWSAHAFPEALPHDPGQVRRTFARCEASPCWQPLDLPRRFARFGANPPSY